MYQKDIESEKLLRSKKKRSFIKVTFLYPENFWAIKMISLNIEKKVEEEILVFDKFYEFKKKKEQTKTRSSRTTTG